MLAIRILPVSPSQGTRDLFLSFFQLRDTLAAMFEIGEKVVCVDDAFPHGVAEFHSALPFEGQIYTVRDITPGQNWDKSETCAVHLKEITGKINQRGIEHGFSSHRFRPLEEDEITEAVAVEETATH